MTDTFASSLRVSICHFFACFALYIPVATDALALFHPAGFEIPSRVWGCWGQRR